MTLIVGKELGCLCKTRCVHLWHARSSLLRAIATPLVSRVDLLRAVRFSPDMANFFDLEVCSVDTACVGYRRSREPVILAENISE